jgi:diguanylate cyclase (GGDEF)-like protein
LVMINVNAETQTMRVRKMDASHQQLAEIMRNRDLGTVYQPLIDTGSRMVFGYEALTRGPSNTWLHSPQNLFEAARRVGARLELELMCAQLAAKRFATMRLEGRLLINISPDAIYEEPRFAERFLESIASAGLSPSRCVMELTEDGLLEDYASLRTVLQQIREAGCDIAIDDLGAGSSGLRIWSELRPEYVKIDRYFVTSIDADTAKQGFVRSIIDLARAIGCRVIAEGVETQEEAHELISLGVDRLQGNLLGRPQTSPSADLDQIAALEQSSTTLTALCAEHLATQVPPLSPQTRVAEVAEMFRSQSCTMCQLPNHADSFESTDACRRAHGGVANCHVSREMLVVAEPDGTPIGIVRRQALFALLSKPLHLEVFNRKPITSVMEKSMLLVDSRLRLEQVSRLLTNRNDARWTEEFIITRNRKYFGIAQTMQLLRIITENQVQTAMHSNPLTLLPGNGPIRDTIKRLLADRRDFVICYVDLNCFKPYNDVYGYAQGDQIILYLADLLRESFSRRIDFVGHVGGDDFILVLRSPDWIDRLKSLLMSFSINIKKFYTPEDFSRGEITAADREGELRHFPLLSISVAALNSQTSGCTSAEAAAQLLADVKNQAKRHRGNSLLLRSNSGIVDLLM